jgi:nucleolar GTP-binding protein
MLSYSSWDDNLVNPFSSIVEPPAVEDLIEISFRRAFSKGKSLKRRRDKISAIRDREIGRIQSVADTISLKLENFVKSFPNIDEIDPFYRELLDVLAGTDEIKHSLGAVFWASTTIKKISRFYYSSMRRESDPDKMAELRREFLGRAVSVLRRVRKEIDFLRNSIPKLRDLPDFDINSPVVIIAGMPNTGKSTLISKLTTKKPEIAPYPFTTKGLIIGHGETSVGRVQFVDTPGLLDRPLSERNKMELQAIAALRHLRGPVIYMMDPTETCGYSLDSQLSLLRELMESLPKPYLVALNKCDIEDGKFPEAERRLEGMKIRALRISAERGDGLGDLINELERILREHEGSIPSLGRAP